MTQSTKGVSTMNLETNKLKAALEQLCLVVPKKGTLPVLENLRWRVVKGHLELTATDLDNSLHISMPFAAPAIGNSVDVSGSGEGALPSRENRICPEHGNPNSRW